uniref:Uncharacterized protein n=1 Tax=Rhizophora mucronata TaxID=61149 RepID=A0A2P2PRY9_RHIMU
MQKLKARRFGSVSPILLGIVPHNWFEAKPKKTSEDMLYIEDGTVPVRLFIVRSRNFKF